MLDNILNSQLKYYVTMLLHVSIYLSIIYDIYFVFLFGIQIIAQRFSEKLFIINCSNIILSWIRLFCMGNASQLEHLISLPILSAFSIITNYAINR